MIRSTSEARTLGHRRCRLWALGLHTLLLAAPAGAHAQTGLVPGDRVRLTAPSLDLDGYRGTIESVGEDTLVVSATSVPLGSITRLQVGHIRVVGMVVGAAVGLGGALAIGGEYQKTLPPTALAGAAIGLSPGPALRYGGLGSVAGAIFGAAVCSSECQGDSDLSKGAYTILYGLIGAGGGFSLGALIGALTHLTTWQDVSLPSRSVGLARARDGSLLITVSVR